MSIITISKPVYENIWTGDIDRILAHDNETGMFSVMNIKTGKFRKHYTSLDACRLSFNSNNNVWSINSDVIKYLISIGVTRFTRLPEKYSELINDTSKKIQSLLELLSKVENGEMQVETESIDGDTRLFITEKSAEDISSLACECLILNDGECYWSNIEILISKGFEVFPIEKDSFGWVVGGIKTSKGIIIYG